MWFWFSFFEGNQKCNASNHESYTLLWPVIHFLLFKVNEINPHPKRIAPPTKGNPAPTKSSSNADHKNRRQNSMPKSPAPIVTTLIKFMVDFHFVLFMRLSFRSVINQSFKRCQSNFKVDFWFFKLATSHVYDFVISFVILV